MSNTIFITANWTTGALSQQTISRQYDNNRYAVQFIGYPEGDGTEELDLYLLVWMSTAPGQKPGEITPIQLNSDQWYISNYFTQQVQVIKFQLCVLNEAGTYEAHSPIFSGRIGDSLEHDGTSHDIDVSTLFDAYREYVEELVIRAGAVIIDPAPTQGSANAVQSGGVYDEITGLKDDLSDIETKLFTISDNLFNIDDIYTNKVPGSVGSSYDTMVALNGWYTSNYIPVTEGEQYALIYLDTITQGVIFRVACYSNGIMTYKTSGGTEPNPFTIPSGVDHVRFYSNTANLFNNRTNTSFKKYSANMSVAWTPYGKQENFLMKGAMPEYGVYVDGTKYYHFVRFGEKTLIRLFKQEGPNNLFQFSALYIGEVSEHGASINETIATNGTDTVGPISIMRQGVDSGGMWASGWHTRTVNGVTCPTAEQQNLDIKINGESIVGVDGLHYGECVATVVNKIYFPQTITGTDLSTATQAIQETVTYTLNEKMTARVAHKYVADTRVILYYGMQAVRIGFDDILLPNNETVFAFADMTANINLDKPEDLMQMSNSEWNYDLVMRPFGLAKYTHNSGAGSTKYGYLPVSTRKVYWALMEGTYDYTFITSGKVLVWEGVWDIYPN